MCECNDCRKREALEAIRKAEGTCAGPDACTCPLIAYHDEDAGDCSYPACWGLQGDCGEPVGIIEG